MKLIQPTALFHALVACLLLIVLLSAGCGVKQDETPNAAVKSGMKSRDQAKEIQAETEKRNKAGEDVLNGK